MADRRQPLARKPGKSDKVTKAEIETDPFGRSCAVDIIIPFHGQYAKVSRALESVLYYTRGNLIDVCLVDDASPNVDYGHTLEKAKYHVVRRDEQGGYGASLLTGFQHTRNPWVCFMHSDCKVVDIHWLKSMGLMLQEMKGDGVKMIGACSNNPGPDADPRMKMDTFGKGQNFVLEGDSFLPLYCVLMSRALFEHIGGFVRPYPYVGYEDQELAHRMRKYGYKQAVCGSSWVWHEGGGTITEMAKIDPRIKKAVEEDNRELCIKHIQALTGTVVKKKPVVNKPQQAKPVQPVPRGPSTQTGNFDPSKVRSVSELIERFGDGDPFA